MFLKRGVPLGLAVLLLLTTAACGGGSSGVTEIAFGTIYPVTGPGAMYGEQQTGGTVVAIEALNKRFEAQKIPIRIKAIAEDHKGVAEPAVTAMNKLVNVDKVPFVQMSYSSTTLAVAPIADKNQVLVINGGGTSPRLAAAGKFVFHTMPLSTYEAVAMANYAFKELGKKQIAIFLINDDVGIGVSDAFAKAFTDLGGKIVARESHEPAAKDLNTQIAKLKAANPDAVYVASHGDDLNLFMRQAGSAGFKPQWLGYLAFPNPNLAKVAGDVPNGAIFTSPRLDLESKDTIIADFNAAYQKKYNKPGEIYSTTQYDTTMIFGQVLESLWKAGKKPPYTGAQLREEMLKIGTFTGVTGKMVFNPKDGTVSKSVFLLKWVGGKEEKVKDLDPQK